MSTSGSSKAAEIAAGQVESIVAAAQLAAEEISAAATREAAERRTEIEAELERRRIALEAEADRLRAEATAEAEKLRGEAREEASRERSAASKEATQVIETARREAAERVSGAEKAADEALADAHAMHAGLRRLAESLSDHAERILRDVQAGHKRLRADLRVTSGPARAPVPGERDEARTRSRPPRAKPFDDIDVPSWVAGEE